MGEKLDHVRAVQIGETNIVFDKVCVQLKYSTNAWYREESVCFDWLAVVHTQQGAGHSQYSTLLMVTTSCQHMKHNTDTHEYY